MRGIHRNSPDKGQCRGVLIFSLVCAWINRWVNNREAGDLRRYRAHYDVTVMGNEWFGSELHLAVGVVNAFHSRVAISTASFCYNMKIEYV